MDTIRPLSVAIRLDKIQYSLQPAPPRGGWLTYLWTVFFKIDGDTTSVSAKLQGTATVVGTPGNHGDLGRSDIPGDIPIPRQLAAFDTVLQPIPVQGLPGLTFGGGIGCIAVLLLQGATPDDAIAKGHDALNSSLQTELNNMLRTLSSAMPGPTQKQIDAMKQRISGDVHDAIKSDISIWQWLDTILAGNDGVVDSKVFPFIYDDLKDSPAGGVPFSATYGTKIAIPDTTGGSSSFIEIVNNWQLTGVILVGPLVVGLRPFLILQGLIPARGIRNPMRQSSFSTVRTWIANKSPNLLP